MKTILAVDDELSIRESYRMILQDQYRVLLAEDGPKALKILEDNHVDLMLLDLMMAGMSGFQVLDEMQRRGVMPPVAVVTALKSVADAVEAMKRGAREYIIKPFDVEELIHTIDKTLSDYMRDRELTVLREAGSAGFESIVGESVALRQTLAMAKRAMEVDSTVLITGESGTGKDLLARAIHSGGPRSQKAFVPVSCCAIPDQLVEAELFGHEKGAFTGAIEKRMGKVQVADGGSLFLDEIGEMPLEAQAKLLRVLQNGHIYPVGSSKVIEVDVRFICATNRELKSCVKAGTFREDLYYRINVLHIELPPLRKRREDIPGLVSFFIAKHRTRVNSTVDRFAPDAMAVMTGYDWPGNIRELENMVERILVLNPHEKEIRKTNLQGILTPTESSEGPVEGSLAEFEGLSLDEATQRLERFLIQRALEKSDYVQSKAAEILHTTRRILKYKMDQLGLDAPSEAGD
ncbi:MAG: sigma-54-dependent Fis family transcriptional regulator [Candidatus Hydrogenedentota bacterium]